MKSSEVKIALVGAAGKMGRSIAFSAHGLSDVTISAAVEHDKSEFIGQDFGQLTNLGRTLVAITSDLSKAIQKSDVVVDLSSSKATLNVIEAAVGAKKPLVCGTTGISEEVRDAFNRVSKTIAVFYTSNFSVGIAVLSSLVEEAAKKLDKYDLEIVEAHHSKKLDAPSGTALKLVKSAAKAYGKDWKKLIHAGRSGHAPRKNGEIGVHAIRGGGIFGEHTAIFAGVDEVIKLSHIASSRALFAKGAVQAAIFLKDKPAGMYTMEDLLDK